MDLLARQPALPRLRSLLPASREARLADSLNKFVFILRIWRACRINKQSFDHFGLLARSIKKQMEESKRQIGWRCHSTIHHFTVFSLDLLTLYTLRKFNIVKEIIFLEHCVTQNRAKDTMMLRQHSSIF